MSHIYLEAYVISYCASLIMTKTFSEYERECKMYSLLMAISESHDQTAPYAEFTLFDGVYRSVLIGGVNTFLSVPALYSVKPLSHMTVICLP